MSQFFTSNFAPFRKLVNISDRNGGLTFTFENACRIMMTLQVKKNNMKLMKASLKVYLNE